jgi:transcriptional antiterminator RfaH
MEFWYTLYTKPNAEYQVATSLQKRGIQAYLPEIESSKSGRKQRKPFFPCYLFIEIDFETVGLSQVQWTPGLRRVVAFDDHPVPLSDGVIDLIRRRLEEMETAESWPAHTFQIGETVRVTDGPLQGLLAIFEGPSAPTQRVQVLLNFLGQVSRAHLPVNDLGKAPPEAQTPLPKRPRRTRGHGRRIKKAKLPRFAGQPKIRQLGCNSN